MSENMKKRFCSVCGASLAEDGSCPVCGHRDESDSVKTAVDNGKEMETDNGSEIAETSGAERMPIDDFSLLKNVRVTHPEKTLGEKIAGLLSNRLANRILVLVISLLLLALVFAPFARYTLEFQTEGEGKETYEIPFTAVDSVELAIRSFAFLSDEALVQTKLYNETLLAQNEGALSHEELIRQNMMLTAMRQSTSVRVTVVAAALLAVVYAVLCTVLVGLAIHALIAELIMRKKKLSIHKKSAAESMLCMIACLLPAEIFCLLQALDLGMYSAFAPSYKGLGVEISWGAIAVVILATLGSIFSCAVNFLETTKNDERRITKSRLRNMVCCVLMIVLIVAMLLPCVTVNVWNESEVTKVMHLDTFDITEMPTNDIKYYRERFREYNEKIVDGMSLSEIEGVFADDTGETLFHTVLIGRKDARALYGTIIAVTAITLICVGLLLFAFIRRCFFGKLGLGGIHTWKVFASISVAVYFITMLILTSTAQGCLQGKLYYIIEFKLSMGVVLGLICMAVAVMLRLKDEKKKAKIQYENPDVSYAPYKLDGKH